MHTRFPVEDNSLDNQVVSSHTTYKEITSFYNVKYAVFRSDALYNIIIVPMRCMIFIEIQYFWNDKRYIV